MSAKKAGVALLISDSCFNVLIFIGEIRLREEMCSHLHQVPGQGSSATLLRLRWCRGCLVLWHCPVPMLGIDGCSFMPVSPEGFAFNKKSF